jgi:hypothetical protein
LRISALTSIGGSALVGSLMDATGVLLQAAKKTASGMITKIDKIHRFRDLFPTEFFSIDRSF